MAKHPIYICSNCLSSIEESKKQPSCKHCNSIMQKKDELIDEWIETHSSLLAQLFNHITEFYQYTIMVDDEVAEFDSKKYELDDDVYEILNQLVDEVRLRLPRAIVLHTTGFYMQEFEWDDFEFNPPINVMDPKVRLGFLFFLDFLSLAMTHAILRDTNHNNRSATLSELVWAHKYFNHVLRTEAGGLEEHKEHKARWPILIYGLFENYIPPVHAINQVWKEAENYQ
ncbi:MAG: hypothetical protein ACW981_11295 [Candidatus Hodarchaeales archaeon]